MARSTHPHYTAAERYERRASKAPRVTLSRSAALRIALQEA